MISDGTGITVESLGNSLLTQFGDIRFEKQVIPYVDSPERADAVLTQLNSCYDKTGQKPLVFMTLVNPDISHRLSQANACFFDLFNTFLGPLERELNTTSSYTVGQAHGVANVRSYDHRIEAINYTIAHDDGLKPGGYKSADIILVGVSRSGKTPSSLYMALQFGILAANYPLTSEDLEHFELPHLLKPYKSKLFGLTIDPYRLKQIRTRRRPNSQYAGDEQCQDEVLRAEAIYKHENIPYLNSTNYSIEEIATKILAISGIARKV